MSGGNGSVAMAGGEGPIRAYLGGNTDFVFIGSVKNVSPIASWASRKSKGRKI